MHRQYTTYIKQDAMITIRWYLVSCFGRDRPFSGQLRTTVKVQYEQYLNPLTPNDPYSGRTAPLTSKHYILYIYSTNISTGYFKHGIYSPFFSLQNAVCFIILTYLVPVLFTILYTVCAKIKKNHFGAKRLTLWRLATTTVAVPHR
jgi:hypothetical protein